MNRAPQASEPLKLHVNGMTCSHCAGRVTDAIQSVPGVASARVVLEQNQATVRWNPSAQPDAESVISAVAQAGFKARAEPPDAGNSRSSASLWSVNVLTGVIPTAILMLGVWVFSWGHRPWFQVLSLLLATVVQFGPGRQFYLGAWRQLRSGRSNMDTLVSLGSTTAFVYSCWILFAGQPHHLYFMEAAAIITLISIGHWLEARTAQHASRSLQKLLVLAPSTARRLGDRGTETSVPVSDLALEDRVLLKPGDRVPTDGIVLAGSSAVDESMLTGESIPVDKQTGTPLYAGTVNLNGQLTMRVTSTGEATALAQIISAVERAQSSRASIQRLADRVSNVFVPVVVLIALGTALWWGLAPEQARNVALTLAPYLWPPHLPETALAGAIITAVAVLIIACPCAMGLATPAAIMAGSNAAAQQGILIRDGIALERAGQITAILFDKTGTLTTGKPAVVDSFTSAAPPSQTDPVRLAATLGRHSNHPLSQAIATLHEAPLSLQKWREISGAGVEALLEGDAPPTARLGSIHFLQKNGVDISPATASIDRWTSDGATVIGLAVDQTLTAAFALKDTIKQGAAQVIEEIRRRGWSAWLVTGDNPRTAEAIARSCGIAPGNVFAEVRPEEKARMVEKLQKQGEKVAFVGDGINDAPALEQADLGIAVSRASDIAREAADLILLNTELQAVPASLRLAQATLRTIKQNLFWAFCYNSLAVPIAALGFMSPVLCAATMGLSDIIVIGNALRLTRLRPLSTSLRNRPRRETSPT